MCARLRVPTRRNMKSQHMNRNTAQVSSHASTQTNPGHIDICIDMRSNKCVTKHLCFDMCLDMYLDIEHPCSQSAPHTNQQCMPLGIGAADQLHLKSLAASKGIWPVKALCIWPGWSLVLRALGVTHVYSLASH